VLAVTRVSNSVSSAPSIRPGTLFLGHLRRGVTDRHQHREHGARALCLGGAHREEGVEECAMEPGVPGDDEVAQVVEHRPDLGARGDPVEAPEGRVKRRAQLEEPVQDLRT